MHMRFNLKMIAGVGLVFLAVLLAGCAEDHIAAEKEILAHDSSFQRSIDHRDSIQKELDSRRTSYIQKKKSIKNEIESLKEGIKDLNEGETKVKAEYFDSLEKIKQRIYPMIRSLKQNLTDMQRLVKRKQIEMRDIDRDIGEIKALVKKKERLSISAEEIQTWNKRFSSLVERKGLIEKEVDRIKKDIWITRLKIKVLTVK